MSKLTDLLKQHNLAVGQYPNGGGKLDKDLLAKEYGNKVEYSKWDNSGSYATIKCEGHDHWIHAHGSAYTYEWPGQGRMTSPVPLSLDLLHEVTKLKKDELEAARKKRFEKITSPRDAVRVTFRDLGIKHEMVAGYPRVNCGPFEMEFVASKDADPKVAVVAVYKRGDYMQSMNITTLTVADPDFNKKVEALVTNGKNLKELLMGTTQPKVV